jgi:hypothetical protein
MGGSLHGWRYTELAENLHRLDIGYAQMTEKFPVTDAGPRPVGGDRGLKRNGGMEREIR